MAGNFLIVWETIRYLIRALLHKIFLKIFCGKYMALASLHEKQRTQIQDMLPQQYYNEKVHIFNT